MFEDGEVEGDASVTVEVKTVDGGVDDVLLKLLVAMEAEFIDVDADGLLRKLAMIACDTMEAADIDERSTLVIVDGIL